MAYELTLNIGGEKKKFVRNDEPVLRDMTNALKWQMNEVKMYQDGVPTDKQLDQEQRYYAKFAVEFWNKAFTEKAFINGLTMDSLSVVTQALTDSLGGNDTEEEQGADKSDGRKNPESVESD